MIVEYRGENFTVCDDENGRRTYELDGVPLKGTLHSFERHTDPVPTYTAYLDDGAKWRSSRPGASHFIIEMEEDESSEIASSAGRGEWTW